MNPESRITVITPTGDRPLAFALCQKWMANQTRQPDQWIVVDDGKVPLSGVIPMQYVRREPKPTDPKHTLVPNLKAAFPLITGNKIIIMEDDEYYAPEYIAEMARRLDSHPIVGLKDARYYHLPTGGYYQNHNNRHASLAQTAFRDTLIPGIRELLNETDEPFLDIRLWKKYVPQGNIFDDFGRMLYLGIKGLPGRAGIGGGHRPTSYPRSNIDSINRTVLQKWVPRDFPTYLDILNNATYDGQVPKLLPKVFCDIIVPSYTPSVENESIPVRCFESIKRCTKAGTYRVIWVDNASDDTSKAAEALKGIDHVALKMSKNVGFVRATNRGLAISNSDYVCLLNNDTVVSDRWLEKMVGALERNPDVGIVGPITAPSGIPRSYDSHHSIQHIEDFARKKIFPPFTNLEDFNRLIEHRFPGHLADITFVAFLCAVIRREVIEKVGLLDIGYEMGMYDDNDYNMAVRKIGIKTKLLYDTCIFHAGRATFNVMEKKEKFDVDGLVQTSHAYMNKKWGLKK